MGKRANPAIVGAFVIGAVVLAVVGVALFGSGRMFRTTYEYVLFFSGDVNGLKPGAPVKLKGVEVGRVAKILLNASQRNVFQAAAEEGTFSELLIPVVIELDEHAFTQRGGHLLPTPDTVKKLIDLGLRARLAMESFVTGVLYVEFDITPGAPLRFAADSTVAYAEIPTLRTPLEEVQMQAAKVLSRLQDIDVKGLIESLARTAEGLDRIINSPHLEETLVALPQTLKNLDGAIADARVTLASYRDLSNGIQRQVGPTAQGLQTTVNQTGDAMNAARETMERAGTVLDADSPLVLQLTQSLADLSNASLALRRLAEDLDRDPSVLLRGRANNEETK